MHSLCFCHETGNESKPSARAAKPRETYVIAIERQGRLGVPNINIKMQASTFEITETWDSHPTNHGSVKITLTPTPEGLVLDVTAPFFNNPPNPGGEVGKQFPQLWDYEVVEVFFLADDEKYLEVELCPHGQHLVLFLDGRRNIIKEGLPLEFKATIDGSAWQGKAHIPNDYFPPKVTRFNAYAIHGSEDSRVYEALCPAPSGKHEQPDFHRLEYFCPAPFADVLPKEWRASAKQLWTEVK